MLNSAVDLRVGPPYPLGKPIGTVPKATDDVVGVGVLGAVVATSWGMSVIRHFNCENKINQNLSSQVLQSEFQFKIICLNS
jgi:hypothetical protein